MVTVDQLLRTKERDTLSIHSDATVLSGLQMMSEHDVDCLVVVEDGKLLGTFSERDYSRKVILKGKFSKDTPIRDMLDTEVRYVAPEHDIEHCMTIMTKKRTRHLPVLENDRIAGIISIGDIIKHILSEKESTIQQLESYIRGDYGKV